VSKLDKAAFAGVMSTIGALPVGLAYKADQIQQERRKEREDKEMSKEEEIKRKQEPSGGGGSETTATNKAYKSGGKVKSASARADGCCIRGKTRA
jgi:hypothetical protein